MFKNKNDVEKALKRVKTRKIVFDWIMFLSACVLGTLAVLFALSANINSKSVADQYASLGRKEGQYSKENFDSGGKLLYKKMEKQPDGSYRLSKSFLELPGEEYDYTMESFTDESFEGDGWIHVNSNTVSFDWNSDHRDLLWLMKSGGKSKATNVGYKAGPIGHDKAWYIKTYTGKSRQSALRAKIGNDLTENHGFWCYKGIALTGLPTFWGGNNPVGHYIKVTWKNGDSRKMLVYDAKATTDTHPPWPNASSWDAYNGAFAGHLYVEQNKLAILEFLSRNYDSATFNAAFGTNLTSDTPVVKVELLESII